MIDMPVATEQFKRIVEASNRKLKKMCAEGEVFTKSIVETGRRELLRESIDKARVILKKLTEDRLESATTKELAQIYNILTTTFKPMSEALTDLPKNMNELSDEELESMTKAAN